MTECTERTEAREGMPEGASGVTQRSEIRHGLPEGATA